MANQLLRDSDVFSMAHSLELRVPFVDHILYSAVLPYLGAGVKNKQLLVNSVSDLSDTIINRPKMGFTFPFAEWLKNGDMSGMINNIVHNKLFDESTIQSYLNLFNSDKIHWSRIWALLIIANLKL